MFMLGFIAACCADKYPRDASRAPPAIRSHSRLLKLNVTSPRDFLLHNFR